MRIGTFFDPAPELIPVRDAVPVGSSSGPAGLVLFSDAARRKYDMLSGEAAQLTRTLKDVTIANTDGAAVVNEALVSVKSLIGEIELTRKGQTKKLKDDAKSIEDTWRGHTTKLEGLRDLLSRKLLIWTQAERERVAKEQAEARRLQEEAAQREADAEAARQEALAKAHAALDEAETSAALAQAEAAEAEIAAASQQLMQARMAEPMAPRGIRTDSGTSGLVENWTYQVTDAAKIPREWLMPDERKIRAAVRGKDGVRHIEGLEIFALESLTTRQRR